MLLLWWMRTALRFVVKCARNLEARVPQLVFSVTVPEHMFWDMLPAPVLIGRQYTKLSFTTDEWCAQKKILDCLFHRNLIMVWEKRVSAAVDDICPLAVVVCVRPWAARVSTAQVCVEIFR